MQLYLFILIIFFFFWLILFSVWSTTYSRPSKLKEEVTLGYWSELEGFLTTLSPGFHSRLSRHQRLVAVDLYIEFELHFGRIVS